VSVHVLPPIRERLGDYEELERFLTHFFRDDIYWPLIEEVGAPEDILQNALLGRYILSRFTKRESDQKALIDAVESGRLRYYRGHFTGNLSAKLSRALRRIGAEWDSGTGTYRIPQSDLSMDLKQAIASSEGKLLRTIDRISESLNQVNPAALTARIDLEPFFNKAIFRAGRDIKLSLEGISVQPELSREARSRIAREYSKSLELPIQEFIAKETQALRARLMERAAKGLRYEGLVKEIESSYGVSQRKAKFLARQETSLLMTKFRQVRYQEAGSDEYIWTCVSGSSAHPVRHYHRLNDGKIFRWDTGAIVNARGDRKNPGQDYNCRCTARPIVRF
jgi:SPP1 gp7 family putative phage head morphogenesis protein